MNTSDEIENRFFIDNFMVTFASYILMDVNRNKLLPLFPTGGSSKLDSSS